MSIRDPDNSGQFLLSRARAPELVEAGDIMTFTLAGKSVGPEPGKPYSERFIRVLLANLYEKIRRQVRRIRLPSWRPAGVTRILALDPWTSGIGLAILDKDIIVHSGMRRVSRTSVSEWFSEKAPTWAEALLVGESRIQ